MFRVPLRLVVAIVLLLGLAAEAQVSAQVGRGRSEAQVFILPADIQGQRAEDMRRQFEELMRRYPPELGRVMKLDPTLMTNADYVAPYPALAAFLKQHPEIARYPGYFLNFVHDANNWNEPVSVDVQRNRDTLRLWQDVMTGLFVLVIFITVTMTITALVKQFVTHRRWVRATKLQSDLHNRMVERLQSSAEILAYAQASARGSDMLGAVSMPDVTSPTLTAPFGRILWSVQAGLVAVAAGVGLLIVKRYVIEEVAQMLLTLGVLILSLGIGFALAAAASYMLSVRLGLLSPSRPAERHESIGG